MDSAADQRSREVVAALQSGQVDELDSRLLAINGQMGIWQGAQRTRKAAMDLDMRIFHAINDFARNTPWLHPIVAGYANYGTILFLLLMLAGWWTARSAADPHRMAAAVWAPFGVLVALAVNQPIADAVGEVRPCNALHDIVVLHCNTDVGFPSDHAVMAGAATVALWLVHRRLGLIAVLASVAMGFARIYIGAHYPQDVLAGYALGAAVSFTGYLLIRPALIRLIDVIARSPLYALVRPHPKRLARSTS